ncbi:MAG: hypothetical protein AAFR61_20050 [Bacteroidota bacterium]
MRPFPLLFLLFSAGLFLHAQEAKLIPLDLQVMTVMDGEDSIHVMTTASDTAPAKPLLLFFQGSLPRPLFIETPQGPMGVFPFDHRKLARAFHLVIIGKPGLPWYASSEQLDGRYAYLDPNTGTIPLSYLHQHFADTYLRRARKVLDTLLTQSWSQAEKLVVAGHSEGAKIACMFAAQDERVSHLAFLGGNPQGRMDQLIREKRIEALQGRLSHEEAQKEIDSLYKIWADIQQSPHRTDLFWGDSYAAWASFSRPLWRELLALDIPIFVAYGSRDIGAQSCDLLPLLFHEAGKKNLLMKVYPGLDHNFFGQKPDGEPDYEAYNWDKVADEMAAWAKAQ